jgi:FkbM family methyltransferase
MLLEKEFGIKGGLVIHAGANMCQERDYYAEANVQSVYWLEAIPKYVEISRTNLERYENQNIVEATLWSQSGIQKSFNISSNNGLSSSLFKMKWHRALQPSIDLREKIEVITTSLDDLLDSLKISQKDISLLVLDLQGAELEALKGAKRTLENVSAIHCEVSRIQLYESQPTFKEIHAFLTTEGFALIKHDLVGENYSGDALYIKKHPFTSALENQIPKDLEIVKLTFRNWIKYKLVQLGFPARLLKRRD